MPAEEQVEFKPYYTGIFSTNYLFQGINTSVFAVVIPIFLIQLTGTISASDLAFLASLMLLPYSLKLIYGILSDKLGTKKIGRRKPWILGPVIGAGIIWMFLSTPGLITRDNAYILVIVTGLLIFTGIAMGDTALDGLIIDICPKEQLGRTQGFCWGMNSVGAIAGGPALAYLLVFVEFINIETIFFIVGVSMVATSLLTLFIKEAKEYPEVKIKFHLKKMLCRRKDWMTYFYSMGRSILDGVVIVLVSLFVLIQLGYLQEEGVSLSTGGTDMNIYIYQANVSFIISLGVIIGSVMGGQIADLKSRRISVYLSVCMTVLSILLIIMDIGLLAVTLFFASLIGLSLGLRRAAASAILGEMSKQHPEMDSTYLSIGNSFANIGASLGLTIIGIVFSLTQSFTITFIFMAILSLSVLIPFLMMNPKDYEYKLADKEA